MTVKSKNKAVPATGDQSKGNGTSPMQPTGGNSVLIGAGGAGVSWAGSTDGEEEDDEGKGKSNPEKAKKCDEKPCNDLVDARGGDVLSDEVELALPGLLPVELKRLYNSLFAHDRRMPGVGGWSFTLGQWVEEDAEGPFLRNERGTPGLREVVASTFFAKEDS